MNTSNSSSIRKGASTTSHSTQSPYKPLIFWLSSPSFECAKWYTLPFTDPRFSGPHWGTLGQITKCSLHWIHLGRACKEFITSIPFRFAFLFCSHLEHFAPTTNGIRGRSTTLQIASPSKNAKYHKLAYLTNMQYNNNEVWSWITPRIPKCKQRQCRHATQIIHCTKLNFGNIPSN